MGISIAHWLASLMWDFILFCLLHITPIIFYSTHSAISMAHAHVLREGWKSLRLFKYETIAWLVIVGIEVGNIFVWRKWSMDKLYDFVGISLLWPCCFEKTWLLYWYARSIIVFMSNDRLLLWITRVLIFMPWLDIWSRLC